MNTYRLILLYIGVYSSICTATIIEDPGNGITKDENGNWHVGGVVQEDLNAENQSIWVANSSSSSITSKQLVSVLNTSTAYLCGGQLTSMYGYSRAQCVESGGSLDLSRSYVEQANNQHRGALVTDTQLRNIVCGTLLCLRCNSGKKYRVQGNVGIISSSVDHVVVDHTNMQKKHPRIFIRNSIVSNMSVYNSNDASTLANITIQSLSEPMTLTLYNSGNNSITTNCPDKITVIREGSV